ncbi:MAG: hypothetical protein WD971_14130 [Pirellulales bacterium]
MTQPVQQVLTAFDALNDADKHVAAIEVLRRVGAEVQPPPSDESLIAATDMLFAELDAREAADAQP